MLRSYLVWSIIHADVVVVVVVAVVVVVVVVVAVVVAVVAGSTNVRWAQLLKIVTVGCLFNCCHMPSFD